MTNDRDCFAFSPFPTWIGFAVMSLFVGVVIFCCYFAGKQITADCRAQSNYCHDSCKASDLACHVDCVDQFAKRNTEELANKQ